MNATLLRRVAVVATLALAALPAGCASLPTRARAVQPFLPEEGRMVMRPPAAPATNAAPSLSEVKARVLRSGDRLEVSLRGIPQPENLKVVVEDEGTVNLPFIGAVRVEGKTAAEAQKLIEQVYIDKQIFKAPTVIIVPPESEYMIGGEVLHPGSYPLTRDLTLLGALARAGRFTEFADSTQVRITRGKDSYIVNARRIGKNQDPDPTIMAGDIIDVPKSPW